MIIRLLLLFFLILSCGKSPLDNSTSNKNSIDENEFSGVMSVKHNLRDEQKSNSSYNVKIHWSEGPNQDGENSFIIIVTNKKGKRVSFKENFHAEIDMPEHGHGSSPFVITEISTGIYEVTEVFFIMPGYWELFFRLKDNGETLSELIWPISL